MTWITIGEGGYPCFMQGGGDEIAEVPTFSQAQYLGAQGFTGFIFSSDCLYQH
jgi:hypothetical protein